MIRFLLALALIPTLFCLSPPVAVAAPQHAAAALLLHGAPEDGAAPDSGATDAACPICIALPALSLPAAETPRFPPTTIALDTSRTGSTVEPGERPPRADDPAEIATAIFKHDQTG